MESTPRPEALAAPFDWSGIAALADLGTSAWRGLFGALEEQQRRFLAHEHEFRSRGYRWPRDPLHQWSRCWEYPFAYHHLQAFRARLPADAQPLALDVGSGVTFFPFAAAELGYRVLCTDIDPVCETDLARA